MCVCVCVYYAWVPAFTIPFYVLASSYYSPDYHPCSAECACGVCGFTKAQPREGDNQGRILLDFISIIVPLFGL